MIANLLLLVRHWGWIIIWFLVFTTAQDCEDDFGSDTCQQSKCDEIPGWYNKNCKKTCGNCDSNSFWFYYIQMVKKYFVLDSKCENSKSYDCDGGEHVDCSQQGTQDYCPKKCGKCWLKKRNNENKSFAMYFVTVTSNFNTFSLKIKKLA